MLHAPCEILPCVCVRACACLAFDLDIGMDIILYKLNIRSADRDGGESE
jgi:hypothetical protein